MRFLEIPICMSVSSQYCCLSWMMHCPHRLSWVIQIPGGIVTECKFIHVWICSLKLPRVCTLCYTNATSQVQAQDHLSCRCYLAWQETGKIMHLVKPRNCEHCILQTALIKKIRGKNLIIFLGISLYIYYISMRFWSQPWKKLFQKYTTMCYIQCYRIYL